MSTTKKFEQVPGFKKYEYNGTILRNEKTKNIISLKKKNNKYQMVSDGGQNLDRSPEQLKELLNEKFKKEQQEKIIKPKIDLKISDKPKVEKTNGEKKKTTMFMVNLLHHQGHQKQDILKQLNITNKVYLDCVWHYDNLGKKKAPYKEKIELYLKKQAKAGA